MSRLTSALLLACAIFQSSPAVSGMPFPSANRNFIAELTTTPDHEIRVTVLQKTNDTKSIYWSRTINWVEQDFPELGPRAEDLKALITNDGNTVILRETYSRSETNYVRIIRKSPAADYLAAPFQRSELTGIPPRDPSLGPKRSGMIHLNLNSPHQLRLNVRYLHVSSLLDFIVEDLNSYALWFGQSDQWLLISLHDFSETIVSDPRTRDALDKMAYAKAKDLVLAHQPPPLRKFVGSLKNRIAEYLPSLATASPSRANMSGETTAAYIFLTTRHVNSDAPFIERLISFPSDPIQYVFSGAGELLDLQFSVTHSERVIGDFLWSRWNGDTTRELIPKQTYQLLPYDSSRYLGSIAFNLELPTDYPRTNAGGIWAFLFPANVPNDQWHRSEDLIAFQVRFSPHNRLQYLSSSGKAIVRALTPGSYRAKFIWDLSPLTNGLWRTNIYVGSPGDLESILTQPISVNAGETVTNISVALTNLVGTNSLPKP